VEYRVEALWPSQRQAHAFTHAERPQDVRTSWNEVMDGTKLVKTARYVNEGG